MADAKPDERSKRELDQELDRQLADTFPASDPTEITRRRSTMPKPPGEPADVSIDKK